VWVGENHLIFYFVYVIIISKLFYMFTRTAFCEACSKKGRPQKDDIYFVYGASHKKMTPHQILKGVPLKLAGFTPHLITVEGVNADGTVNLDLVCGMGGCGVSIFKHLDEYDWVINHSRKTTISEADFKKLYEYKDLGYRL
jgi:hypothetical protein